MASHSISSPFYLRWAGARPQEGGFTLAPAALSIAAIVLLTLAVHGPLLMLQLPLLSADAGRNMVFAQHYAQGWFHPWNEKMSGGFSQTLLPPLAHQWVGLLSSFLGLTMAYMAVQLCAVLLVAIGTYRFSRIWTDDAAARLAAICAVFLGSGALLIYQEGNLPVVLGTGFLLTAIGCFYDWCRTANLIALLSGLFLMAACVGSDASTAICGGLLFGLPAFVRASTQSSEADGASTGWAVSRAVIFAVVAVAGSLLLTWPMWKSLLAGHHALPVANGSRDNLLLHGSSLANFLLLPYGALLFALPLAFQRGAARQLRPLFFGFYAALLIGLGGTTPVAHWVLRGEYDQLTLLRFSYWATLLMLPLVAGPLARLLEARDLRAAIALPALAILTFSLALTWMKYHPLVQAPFKTEYPINFMNRENHNRYRYLTLGFGPAQSEVALNANARSIDTILAESANLPELAPYGALRLDSAREYGTKGMEALRAVLKHANNYGLKFIFVRDRFYEPLIAFAGWRQVESYDNGNVTLWSKEDVPAARPPDASHDLGLFWRTIWGTGVFAASILGLLLLGFTQRAVVAQRTVGPAPLKEAI